MKNELGMKNIAKKHEEKLEIVYGERGDVWAETVHGYMFESTGCHTAHEFTQADMRKEFKTIVPCDCEQCEANLAEADEEVEESENEFEINDEVINVHGVFESITIEVPAIDKNSVLVTLHGDHDEVHAGILCDYGADFGDLNQFDAYRLEVIRKANEIIKEKIVDVQDVQEAEQFLDEHIEIIAVNSEAHQPYIENLHGDKIIEELVEVNGVFERIKIEAFNDDVDSVLVTLRNRNDYDDLFTGIIESDGIKYGKAIHTVERQKLALKEANEIVKSRILGIVDDGADDEDESDFMPFDSDDGEQFQPDDAGTEIIGTLERPNVLEDEDVNSAEISVWVGSLSAYNAGHLIGKWITLPKTAGEFHQVMVEINSSAVHLTGDYSEEIEIFDINCNIPGMSQSLQSKGLDYLNDIAKQLEDDDDIDVADISVWVGSLSAYNSGHLIGRWVSLPKEADELHRIVAGVNAFAFHATGDQSEEVEIFDINCNIPDLSQSLPTKGLDDLNAIAEELEDMHEIQRYDLPDIIEITGDLEQAIDRVPDAVIVDNVYNDRQLGEALHHFDLLMEYIPDELEFFIDWELVGREYQLAGIYTITSRGQAVHLMK